MKKSNKSAPGTLCNRARKTLARQPQPHRVHPRAMPWQCHAKRDLMIDVVSLATLQSFTATRERRALLKTGGSAKTMQSYSAVLRENNVSAVLRKNDVCASGHCHFHFDKIQISRETFSLFLPLFLFRVRISYAGGAPLHPPDTRKKTVLSVFPRMQIHPEKIFFDECFFACNGGSHPLNKLDHTKILCSYTLVFCFLDFLLGAYIRSRKVC